MELSVRQGDADAAGWRRFRSAAGVEALTREQLWRAIGKLFRSIESLQLVSATSVLLGDVRVDRGHRAVREKNIQISQTRPIAHEDVFAVAQPIRVARRGCTAIGEIDHGNAYLGCGVSAS